ncbi:sodium:proton antiporter [Gammaproteobacteria bacterium 45_16_T64]|nr:sodium:proton antiporter [Gammaproteobacteria bacterium 45_16_T64]
MHDDVFSLVAFGVFGLIALNVLSYYSRRLMVLPDIIWVLLLGVGYGGVAHFLNLGLPELTLSPNLVLYAFVPPLIFASTQKICLFHFSKVLAPASLVGSVGILISMIIIGSTLHYGFGFQWLESLLFGVILSATDPLAVGALLHGNDQVSESQKLLIEGESILNDGFVVTVTGILVLILFGGESFNFLGSSGTFLVHVVGALLLGVALGRGARGLLSLWKGEHFTLTINMTLAIAFGSFTLAEMLHLSGILAVFSTALAYGYKPDEENQNKLIHRHIWDYFEYIANAVLFFLLGASFFVYTSIDEGSLLLVFVCLVLLVGSRLGALIALFPLIKIENNRLNKRDFWLLNFSGARGAVSIALILLLPDTFELKSLFLSLAFVMILFSLVVYPVAIKKVLD